MGFAGNLGTPASASGGDASLAAFAYHPVSTLRLLIRAVDHVTNRTMSRVLALTDLQSEANVLYSAAAVQQFVYLAAVQPPTPFTDRAVIASSLKCVLGGRRWRLVAGTRSLDGGSLV